MTTQTIDIYSPDLAMDPPRHVDYRRPLAPSFKAKVMPVSKVGSAICRQIFERVGHGEVEFVHDVTSSLPSQVMGELVGLPEDDWPKIHRWAEMSTSGQDREINPQDGVVIDPIASMARYAVEFALRRRQEEPRPDLTSLILGTEFGGHLMSEVDFGSFFVQLVTAGNDTTKTMLSSGLLALLERPEQLAELRADRSLIDGAVEEILRWVNPLHYFRRTATANTTLRRVGIKAGDKVAMQPDGGHVELRAEHLDARRVGDVDMTLRGRSRHLPVEETEELQPCAHAGQVHLDPLLVDDSATVGDVAQPRLCWWLLKGSAVQITAPRSVNFVKVALARG